MENARKEVVEGTYHAVLLYGYAILGAGQSEHEALLEALEFGAQYTGIWYDEETGEGFTIDNPRSDEIIMHESYLVKCDRSFYEVAKARNIPAGYVVAIDNGWAYLKRHTNRDVVWAFMSRTLGWEAPANWVEPEDVE